MNSKTANLKLARGIEEKRMKRNEKVYGTYRISLKETKDTLWETGRRGEKAEGFLK